MRLFGSVKGKSVFNLFAKTNGEQLPKEEFTVEKTNDNLTQPAQDRFKLLREYAVITAGLFLAALAIYFFMMPSNIIFGSIFDENMEDEMRVTVIATGFEMKPETNAFAPKAAAGARPSTPSFVPEDIDTPVAASRQPTKPADMGDIDEIFSIFKR